MLGRISTKKGAEFNFLFLFWNIQDPSTEWEIPTRAFMSEAHPFLGWTLLSVVTWLYMWVRELQVRTEVSPNSFSCFSYGIISCSSGNEPVHPMSNNCVFFTIQCLFFYGQRSSQQESTKKIVLKFLNFAIIPNTMEMLCKHSIREIVTRKMCMFHEVQLSPPLSLQSVITPSPCCILPLSVFPFCVSCVLLSSTAQP